MNSASRDRIKRFVEEFSRPTAAQLVTTDGPKFSTLEYLASKIVNLQLRANLSGSKVEFLTGSGLCLFSIDVESGLLGGDLAPQIDPFLMAIRIHEVESYEWVNLPGAMRIENLAAAAAIVGTSVDELKRLSNRWTD